MTKEDIFNNCLNETKEFRTQQILNSKNYLKTLYTLNGVVDLFNKLGENKIKKAKLLLNNEDTLILENENKEIKTNLLKIFKANNVNLEKLTPNFNCKICNDNGIVNDKICNCLQEKYNNALLNYTETNLIDIPTLNQINASLYSNEEMITKLISNLQKLAVLNTKFNTILFCGETGTGKTYISKSFLKTFVLNNKLGLYINAFNLNNELLKYHTTFDNNKNLNRFLVPDILVIDDLGTENIYKNVTLEYLLYILNERQQANKITLFSTNLTLQDIKARYTDRFLSRLLDKNCSLKYNFIGNDLRK